MLFLSFSPSGVLQKEIARCYSQWPCCYECFQWTALSLHNFWVNTVILPWVHVYSKGFFPIGFALHKLYSTCFNQQQIFTHYKMWVLQLHSMISSSWKTIYYIYLNVILLSFLSKSEVQATNNSHLPGFVSWKTLSQTHFLRFETKLSQIFFFFFLLFPELHITFQLYQGFCLLEDCVKLLFCVTTSFNMTRIHFSTKRPLVKILQRKLIGKCTIYYSLSERKKVKVKSSVVSDSLQPHGL